MKIHDKLWYIINPDREDNLAYMTYWEDNSACLKRMETGTNWATPRKTRWDSEQRKHVPVDWEQPVGVQIDNTPASGFYIGSSVCRWSTENKVFRVTDPRGFTVEVPTGNISTLLHLTDVHKGVIQQECIWARDGNSHVLLPVNSEPYLETLKKMDKVANAMLLKELKLWDVVKELSTTGDEYRREYVYIGQYKVNWHVIIQEATYDFWRYRSQGASTSERYKLIKDLGIIPDPKWEHYFLTTDYKDKLEVRSLGSNPRLVKLRSGEDASDKLALLPKEQLPSYAPERVVNKYRELCSNREQSVSANFDSLGERRK